MKQDERLAPLVVVVRGHPFLVAEFQRRVQPLIPALSLDSVARSNLWGGAYGTAYLEWTCGFSCSPGELLGAPLFPDWWLVAPSSPWLRASAVRRALEFYAERAALACEGLALGVPLPVPLPEVKPPPAPPRPRGRPRKGEV